MICDFDRIDALCAGELTDDERASVLAHMEHCPACRAYYEALAGLEGEETAPEGFTERVMDTVRATPQVRVQRRARRVWHSVAAMAACAALVVTLGLNSGLFSAEADPADAAESAPTRSAEAGGDGSDFSGYQSSDSFTDNAGDLTLTVHTLEDAELCAQVRAWLSQQNIPQLYPDGSREAYDLTVDQVKALKDAFPLLTLPEEFLQLELKRAE